MAEAAAARPAGMLLVVTGNGKGKTTSAFGQALRAVGHGAKVLIIQFMKGSDRYGEVQAVRRHLSEYVLIEQYGREQFVDKANPASEDLRLAQRGLARAREALASGEFGLVILDEVNVAVDFGLVTAQDLLKTVEARESGVDVMVTGRYAPPAIVQAADLVSEVLDIKHPFTEGVAARVGIEY